MTEYAKYNGTVLNPSNGEAVYGVSITVKLAGTATLADLYTDEIGTAGPNPVTSATNGKFWFYIVPGDYDLYLSGAGVTPTTLSDITIGNILLAGRSGGLSVYGGTDSGNDLHLYSNPLHDGKIYLGPNIYYNEESKIFNIDVASSAANGILIRIRPDDYESYGSFNIAQGKNLFLGDRYDQVFNLGYNVSANGGQENPAEPCLQLQIETWANLEVGVEASEIMIAYSDGDFGARPWFWGIDRNTHEISAVFVADSYIYKDHDDNPSLSLAASGFYLYGSRAFIGNVNNVVLLGQMNAAGTGSCEILKLNASDKAEFVIDAQFNGNAYIAGNLGIRNATPFSPLSFGTYLFSSGKKFALYEGESGETIFGFGIRAGILDTYVGGDIITSVDVNTHQFNIVTGNVFAINGIQVVGARVIDARCDDAINSGDATTDGVIDALRDAMIQHGLIAAA